MTYGDVQEVEGKVFSVMTLPKHSFGVRKDGKYYVADHINSGRSIGIEEKTEKAAIDKVFSVLTDKKKVEQIKNAPSVEETVNGYKHLQALQMEFKELTDIELPINNAYGVDLFKLDEIIETPEGVSMSDCIKEKYGVRADEVLQDIVNSGLVVARVDFGPLTYFMKKVW